MKKLKSFIWHDIIESLPIGVILLDYDGNICAWNNWLVTNAGKSVEDVVGNKLTDLYPDVNSSRFEFAIEQVLHYRHPQVISQVLNHHLIPIKLNKGVDGDDSNHMQQSVAIAPIVDGEQTYALISIINVTENYNQRHVLLKAARRFEEEGSTDPLTGAYNRRYLWEYLSSEEVREKKMIVVCTMLDLDYFKKVNDELGHEAGDSILVSFAKVLQNNIRADDKIFRYGGEEFLIVSFVNDVSKVGIMAQKIVESLAAKTMHEKIKRRVTCSAGYSYAVHNSYEPRVLVREADKALYKAKDSGRNRVCAFSANQFDIEVNIKSLDILNSEVIQHISAGDSGLEKAIYKSFLDENKSEGTELKMAISGFDIEKIIFLTHKLKSSAGAIGAKRLAAYAKSVEHLARNKDRDKLLAMQNEFLTVLDETVKAINDKLK